MPDKPIPPKLGAAIDNPYHSGLSGIEWAAMTIAEAKRRIRNEFALDGYGDRQEALDDAAFMRETGGRRYGLTGFEIGPDELEEAVEFTWEGGGG